jgi:phage host-nuclease inhibitor protein Gam
VARLNGEAVARDCEVFELEDTKRKMQQKIDQLARTQEELQTALSCYGELQRDHAQLKENLEFSLADNDEYKHKLASSLAKEQILNKELLRLNEALETTKDELTATTRKTQTLDAERRQLFMKTQEMDNLNTSLARLRDLSDDLRRQVDQHKTAKDQFERENRKLQAQVEQLFRELNDRQEKLEAAHKDLKKKEFLNDFKSRVVSGTTTSNKQQVRSHVEQAAPLDTTTESPSFLFKTALAPVPLPVQSATSVRTAEQASVSVSNHSAEHDENGARLGDSSSGDGGQLGDDGLGRAWKEAISRYPMNIKDLVSRKAGNSSEFLFGTKEVVCKQMGLNVTVQYGGENLLLPKFLDKYGYSESQKRRKSILQAAPNNNNSNKPAIKFKLKLANRKDYLSSNNNN